MPRSKATKITPKTKHVFDYLVNLEDFATPHMIADALRDKQITYNNVTAILHTLKRYTAVDSMASDNKLWFYATPETDTRSRTLDLRSPEENPRRPHARRKNKTA